MMSSMTDDIAEHSVVIGRGGIGDLSASSQGPYAYFLVQLQLLAALCEV